MTPNHYTFFTGQIVALRGIAAVSPILRDHTYEGEGRPYFTITYQAGAEVEVPADVRALAPPMTPEEVDVARAGFVMAVGVAP